MPSPTKPQIHIRAASDEQYAHWWEAYLQDSQKDRYSFATWLREILDQYTGYTPPKENAS